MDLWVAIQALILGVVEGVTEFLPVSSSGHLLVMRELMGLENIPILFDILMHVPTLLAVIIVFRQRITKICLSIYHLLHRTLGDEDRYNLRLLALIALASTATAAVGLAAAQIQDLPLFSTKAVGVCFILTALILGATRFFFREDSDEQTSTREKVTIKTGIVTGIAQGLGVLPGISRAGMTISAAIASGMDRRQAGEFAFLISIPAIIGALALKARDIETLPMSAIVLAAGMVASFAAGLISLLLLLSLIRKGRLYFFAFYLLPLGIATVVFG